MTLKYEKFLLTSIVLIAIVSVLTCLPLAGIGFVGAMGALSLDFVEMLISGNVDEHFKYKMGIYWFKTIASITYFVVGFLYLFIICACGRNVVPEYVIKCYRGTIVVCIFALADGIVHIYFNFSFAYIFFIFIIIHIYLIISMIILVKKMRYDSERVVRDAQERGIFHAGTGAQISDGTGMLPKFAMTVQVKEDNYN